MSVNTLSTAPEAGQNVYTLGPLYDLVTARMPELRTNRGVLDVNALAKMAQLSHESVYRSFRNNRLTVTIAKRLIKASGDRITREELLPFLFD